MVNDISNVRGFKFHKELSISHHTQFCWTGSLQYGSRRSLDGFISLKLKCALSHFIQNNPPNAYVCHFSYQKKIQVDHLRWMSHTVEVTASLPTLICNAIMMLVNFSFPIMNQLNKTQMCFT